ncbi:hypothetical protein BASA60_004905 [Batrachochytrium salamandrivorans]|nr:hypothetical protein BASA60_004905 [Batrachochytrium salamandrivorans]
MPPTVTTPTSSIADPLSPKRNGVTTRQDVVPISKAAMSLAASIPPAASDLSSSSKPTLPASSILSATVRDRKGVVQRASAGNNNTGPSSTLPIKPPSSPSPPSSSPPSSPPPPPPLLLAQIPLSFSKSLLFRAMIFRKILLLNDGRDKILKCVQYAAKLLLWCYLSAQSKKHPVSHARAMHLASHFSLARKMVRLGHWLEPINDYLEFSKNPIQDMSLNPTAAEINIHRLAPLNAGIGILNDVCDDVICLSKMGLLSNLSPHWIQRATTLSDRCWYTSIFVDLYTAYHARQKLYTALAKTTDPIQHQAITDKIFMQHISIAKLSMDFVFCSVDVLKIGDQVSQGVQIIPGFLSALLGTFKLYRKVH